MRMQASIAVLGLALAAQSAIATDGPQKDQFFVSLLGAYYDTRGDYRTTDSDLGLGLGLGWSFADNWAVEGQYYRFEPDARIDGVDGSIDIDLWSLGLLRSFDIGQGWSPYVAFGIGEGRFDQGSLSDRGTSKDEQAHLGVGFFGNLSERFAIRGDMRGVYHNRVDSIRPLATLGFTMMLGGSPAPAPVAAPAPEPAPVVLDSDGDGVPDAIDECPGTPRGARVDERGCEIEIKEPVSFNLTVEFAFASAEINSVSYSELMDAIRFLREHPSTVAEVEGHTDNVGSAAYNQGLSERRAEAVKGVLVNSGIAADRLTSRGYGFSRPIASNDTDAGRQQNRRVTVVVSGRNGN